MYLNGTKYSAPCERFGFLINLWEGLETAFSWPPDLTILLARIGHQKPRSYFNKKSALKYFKVLISRAIDDFLLRATAFDPGHLNLSVHDPDGPPNFKTLHNIPIRGFHKHTTLAIMPILASEALQCDNIQ